MYAFPNLLYVLYARFLGRIQRPKQYLNACRSPPYAFVNLEECNDRRDASPRGAMTLDQCEQFHFVTKTTLRSCKRPRLAIPNTTTSGTVLGPMRFPDKDDSVESWVMPIGDKKKIYGAARLLPGGPSPDGANPQPPGSGQAKRNDATPEPLSHHGTSLVLWKELLHQVGEVKQQDVKAVIDLTAGDGNLGSTCLEAGIPYLGVCFNEVHRAMLAKRFESVVFKMFLQTKSPLHRPGLCKLLGPTEAASAASVGDGQAKYHMHITFKSLPSIDELHLQYRITYI